MKERFQTFTVLIAKISRNIRKIKNQEMAEYNLRNAHVSCLYYLYVSDSLTATELCDQCEEDKATVSRALDFLEAEGFVLREPRSGKRYNTPLCLTEKGREVGKAIKEKIDLVLDEICIDLTEEERERFYRSLAVISDSLEMRASGLQRTKKNKTEK